tara:strand:+ start:270 stop:1199 length:930 start_codon:yes stop_codon:yes gene_type:complete
LAFNIFILMKNIIKLLKIILNHPLNANNKFRSILRFLSFNLKKISNKGLIIFPWVGESKLIFDNTDLDTLSQRQIKFNYYLGLVEYEDMAFLIHCLKKENVFIDCGANLGMYTILASKVLGSDTIAFEPHPETVTKFFSLLQINNVTHKVKIINKAIGNKIDEVNFSNEKDALRRKVIKDKIYDQNSSIKVKMTTLDNEISDIKKEFILKMDLEGFEYSALKGAALTLKNKNLKAIIVENNDKYNKNSISELLAMYGFFPIEYFPQKKEIKIYENNPGNKLNLIFIRNLEKIKSDCLLSKNFKVNSVDI